MKTAGLYLSMALLIVSISPAAAQSSATEKYESSMLGLSRSKGLSLDQKADQLKQIYDAEFAQTVTTARPSDDELEALFKAANMMASYTLLRDHQDNPIYVGHMRHALSELQRRNLAGDREIKEMYGALIAARMFEEASAIAKRSPTLDLPQPPSIDTPAGFDQGRPAYFEIEGATGQLKLKNDAQTRGVRIIVVAGCHVALDAANAIASDKELQGAFHKANTLWLTPAERTLDIAEISEWNRKFPQSPMRIAYTNRSWQGLDFSNKPTFYFYKDGVLLSKHVGWSRGGVPAPILTALREARLIR